MDQVESKRELAAEVAADPLDGAVDGLERQPGRPEDAQHSAPAHGLDHLDRADSVCHRSRHASKSCSVRTAKRGVSQLFQSARWNKGDEPLEVKVGCGRGRAHDQVGSAAPIDDQKRISHLADGSLQRLEKFKVREPLQDATPHWITLAALATAEEQPANASQQNSGMSRYTSRNAERTEDFGR